MKWGTSCLDKTYKSGQLVDVDPPLKAQIRWMTVVGSVESVPFYFCNFENPLSRLKFVHAKISDSQFHVLIDYQDKL